MNPYMDKKEEVYAWLPRAEDIAPGKVFGKGEGSAQKMSAMIGIGVKAALNNLNRLKAENRAHIHAWTQSSCPAPVWVKGPGEDAPKAVPMTRPELLKRQVDARRERRASEASMAQEVGTAVERTARTIERARQQPCDPFAALFDPAAGA